MGGEIVVRDQHQLTSAKKKKKKKKKKKMVDPPEERLSYHEMAALAQQRYRDQRVPRRKIIPEPPPPLEVEDNHTKKNVPFCRRILRLMPTKAPGIGRYGLSPEAEKAIRCLCITKKQLRTLHRRFEDIDTMGIGQISKQDFWAAVGIHPSAYTDKLFEMIDADGSGMMVSWARVSTIRGTLVQIPIQQLTAAA